MDVRILAQASCLKGGAEGEHRNIVALLEQSGDMAPPLYIVTFQILDGRTLRLSHWCRSDYNERDAHELYAQGCRDFIEQPEAEPSFVGGVA